MYVCMPLNHYTAFNNRTHTNKVPSSTTLFCSVDPLFLTYIRFNSDAFSFRSEEEMIKAEALA